jgi:hypothetical protein
MKKKVIKGDKNKGHVTGILPIKNSGLKNHDPTLKLVVNDGYTPFKFEESLHGHITPTVPIKPMPFVVVGEVPKGEIVNALIVAAFRLDDEAFGWLMDKLNQRKAKSKMLEGILEEMLDREQEIIYDVKRFNGVSTSHIKRVFEKYGIVNEDKF